MKLLEDSVTWGDNKTSVVFKDTRLINAQTTKTIQAKAMVFCIAHRFGNLSDPEGVHTLYGLYDATNIRFSLDYGITDKLMAGFGKSKVKENLDASVKYRIVEQSKKVPLSATMYFNMAFTPMKDPFDVWPKNIHRISYTSQVILSRKFCSRFSFAVLPTILHRNAVLNEINESNGTQDENTLFSLGFAGRVKITKSTSLVADYFYTFSDYRRNNPATPYYAPLGIGVEMETGGHVFNLYLTNAAGIIENDFIPDTNNSWSDLEIKLGFHISRVFYLKKPKQV